jgi:class 3 adenylate cyclase
MLKTDKLISTAIMKTDIIGFSNIVGELTDFELSKLLGEHKDFIIRNIYKYDGSIIKGEGDAFLISFSSVTSATESAVAIQRLLRKRREKSESKFHLALRIIISLGDVMHKDNDVFGESVNIVSRIEKITPPDEIYLSEPAYLTLRKQNLNLEYVNEFEFKGFSSPQKIYKVIIGSKIIIQDNVYILFSDMEGMAKLFTPKYFDLVEKHIDHQDNMFQNVIREQNGKLRNIIGDAYIITFDKIDHLVNAINYINKYWNDASNKYGLNKMRLGCHKGSFFTYRSLFGSLEVNTCAVLESTGKGLIENNDQNIRLITHVSKLIRDEALKYDKTLKGNFRKVTSKEMNERWRKRLKSTYSYQININSKKSH